MFTPKSKPAVPQGVSPVILFLTVVQTKGGKKGPDFLSSKLNKAGEQKAL